MLQPRLTKCDSVVTRMGIFSWRFMLLACLLVAVKFASCQDVQNEDSEPIDATRLKRDSVLDGKDLTVLLLNDQKRPGDARVGRYHSIKPLIGLLTSTARTFIQDGVTTEYATQILGTTLDNGRIYAQLLTKSSLVLYNKPSTDDDVIVKPTKVPSVFDGQWSVKQELGFIDPDNFVLKNTDYLSPNTNNKMSIVYANNLPTEKYYDELQVALAQSDNQIEEPVGRRVQPIKEIPRYSQNDILNLLDGPVIENEKEANNLLKPSILTNVNNLHRQTFSSEIDFRKLIPEKNYQIVQNDTVYASEVHKIRVDAKLPTFTIKNEFSPIFYYIDNVETKSLEMVQATKTPKKLFGHKSEHHPKTTFTYAGFADFTTVVGDTVIIFTPNTDLPPKPSSQSPEKPFDNMASKITFLASDIPLATATYKADSVYYMKTKVSSKTEETRSEKALSNDDESLKKVLYDINDQIPDDISVQYHDHGLNFNIDAIQSSEVLEPSVDNNGFMSSLGVIPIKSYNSEPTESLQTISSYYPSTDSEAKETTTEDNVDITTIDQKDDAEDLNESLEITLQHTTTESTNPDTSEEKVPYTSEEKVEDESLYCTNGVEIFSTMTTAYKTLTYLTTFFIPLEGTETTTSIESSIAVESQIGYLTNTLCKESIEPTLKIYVNPSQIVHQEQTHDLHTEITRVEPTENSYNSDIESTTSGASTLSTENVVSELEDHTEKSWLEVINERKNETFLQNSVNISKEVETKLTKYANSSEEFKTETSSPIDGNSILSVVTEESMTEKEIQTTPQPEESEEIDSSENEIDLIYKTLYTTYTYFTTFFQDSSSSIASHKSVVTNVITSTVDLSRLGSHVFDVFDDVDISPTRVGERSGQSTEAIHSIIDLVKNKDVIESVQNNNLLSSHLATPSLDSTLIASIKPDAVKTYYTTYTYFTTIFVGKDANICSRSEIHTNYVGPEELIPTKTTSLLIESSRKEFDFRNCKQVKNMEPSESNESIQVESSQKEESTSIERDMLFSADANPLGIEGENAYVTDVKSSFSKGEKKFIENNNILEDQVSSETNIDEIVPSPTLLLQTSYTTFTYFTTMYIGKDSSKVKSRLETITNVVTETLAPKKASEVSENNLPITYYTTFTYWTTLYKDKSTTITSREEIISNVVTPSIQSIATVSPIDTTPIDTDNVLPPKDLEVEIKPSLVDEKLGEDDEKATFYTTYTYFTTFYVGNTSQIRSSLETITNIVDNTKINDNQLGRAVGDSPSNKNLINGDIEKPLIVSTILKEQIKPTELQEIPFASSSVLQGTYIDNLYAEVQSNENASTPAAPKKILFSHVAVISGDSTVVTSDNKTLINEVSTSTTTTTETNVLTPSPDVIESSLSESSTTTESKLDEEDPDDGSNSRKKSRLTFSTKKPSFTPVIRPFVSRARPTFSPKRVPVSSATTITRSVTPTITATPSLKSVRSSGFGNNRKQQSSAYQPSSSGSARRFSGRSSSVLQNSPSASRPGFGSRKQNEIQPSSRRNNFRSSSNRNNAENSISRSSAVRIRPTASIRLRGSIRPTVSPQTSVDDSVINESETLTTLEIENATEQPDEVTEPSPATPSNPLSRLRRPLQSRQPGSAVTPKTNIQTTRRSTTKSRGTTTTARTTPRTTTPNPLFARNRQRQNALFPRRNLFKQPEPVEEETKESEPQSETEEVLEEGEEDNEYESSNNSEQQLSIPSTTTKKPNAVQIRPFGFRRRSKRQIDYGTRKFSNFRRPSTKPLATNRRIDPETETEAPSTPRPKLSNRYTGRSLGSSRTTTVASPARGSTKQQFIIRGESRSTTTSTPSYRARNSRPLSRPTTSTGRSRTPRPQTYGYQTERNKVPSRTTSRSRTRGSSRSSTRFRSSHDFNSGSSENFNELLDDGKITITHHIPTEVTIPVVNGKITEYKNVLTAKPKLETLMRNQLSTSLGPLGIQQLYVASESTQLGDNGITKVIKFLLHETPTSTVVFTPTTIRGRKTSYSHLVPSTVFNVEYVTSTLSPEINANVPLANLLLSQLLLGNPQQAGPINPLLALQGQGLVPQQPLVQTPVTEFKTRTTSYVTTVTDAKETVLPITFRGKEILTTIRDPTTKVITATEFITDTLVTTPTAFPQQQGYNSLLLPLLLQQQQQQQALALQTTNPLLGLGGAQPDLSILQHNLLNNDIYNHSPKPNIQDIVSNEEYSDEARSSNEDFQDDPPLPPVRSVQNKPKPPRPAPNKLTSVVTLYLSGRTPGEFSTVLSTVVTDDTQTVRKREATFFDDIPIIPSYLPTIDEVASSRIDDLDNSILNSLSLDIESQIETQSLESIVGELTKHLRLETAPTYVVKQADPSVLKYESQSLIEDVS